MALTPRRSPLTSLLSFAADRDREANSIGSVITQLAGPALSQVGVRTAEQPQAAVMRGPVPMAQPLGAFSGPALAPTPVEFSQRSTELLANTDPRLRDIMTETERRAKDLGIDIEVGETLRSRDRQADMVAQGKSQTYNSKHLTGNAADIHIIGPDGKPNWDFEAYRPVADIAKEVAAEKGYDNFVWGGDWKTLKDGVHFQLGGAAASPSTGRGSASDGAAPAMGGNVEDILAQLYPQPSPEDEKRQRRKDFFAAASQGLSALSQGRPIDFSNIRQAQDERKQRAVTDMRERERARAAAALVYSQTGDANLATGIATGAIGYNDVLSERQIARAEKEADRLKLLSAQQAQILAPTLLELGLPQARVDEIVAYGEQGGDINDLLTPMQASETAKKVRESEAVQDELVTSYLDSADPTKVMIGQLVRGGLPLKDAVDAAAKLQPATGGKEFANIAEAEALYTGGAINPATGLPFTSQAEALATLNFYKAPSQDQGVSLTMGPGGVVTGLTVGGAAPAATPGAVVDVAKPAAGTATVVGANGALTEQPMAGAIAPQTAAVELEAKRRELEAAKAAAPDVATKAAAEARLAEIKVQQEQLALQEAQASQGVSVREAEARIAADEAKVAEAQRKTILRAEQTAMRSNNTMRLLSDVYDKAEDFAAGPVAGLVRGAVASVFPASEAGQAQGQLAGVEVGIFADQLAQMRESSPTGAAVGNVTEGERAALASTYGALSIGGDPDVLRQNIRAVANAALDMQYGRPDSLRQAVIDGKLDAETAERYGARYDIDGTADTGMTGALGPVVPLGMAVVDATVLSKTPEQLEAEIPADSPDPAFERRLLDNPAAIEGMTFDQYKALSPEQKAVFDRLAREGEGQ